MAKNQKEGDFQTEVDAKTRISRFVDDEEINRQFTEGIWSILRRFDLTPKTCHYQEQPLTRGQRHSFEASIRPRPWDIVQATKIVAAFNRANFLARLNVSNITVRNK